MKTPSQLSCRLLFCAICAVFVLVPTSSAQAQISVIVSKKANQIENEKKIDKNYLKEVFTGAKLKWSNGKKINVIDQPQTEIGQKFYELIIGKSQKRVKNQWLKLMLSGQASKPLAVKNDETVIRLVLRNPNAIGYIDSDSLVEGGQEIFRIETEKKDK